jgi:cobalt-zinc-cadmium efflux system outer membrane protein
MECRLLRCWTTSLQAIALLSLVPAVRADDAPEPLTLPRLLELAAKNHPELTVARARVDAARGQMIQAGLYPNPVVTPGFEELGNKDGPAGTPGVSISQDFVTAGKLRLAQAAAGYGLTAADRQATTRWFAVVTKVRTAYYEVLTARREVETGNEAVRISEESLKTIKALALRGLKAKPDELRAQVEYDQNRIRLNQAQERQKAADKLMAAAVGLPALPNTPIVGSIDAPAPRYDYQNSLEVILARSSEVQAAQAAIQQAQQLFLRAQAERRPDIRVAVRPAYSNVDKTPEVMVEVGAALPIFNRNQGNIISAEAEVRRAVSEARAIDLRLTERLTAAYQRYAAARSQVEIYEKEILPNAREAERLLRIGYESGDPKSDYTSLLEAQRTLVQTRLMHVQVRGELWRAASEIAGMLQDEESTPELNSR